MTCFLADTNFVLANYKTEPCKRPPRLCRQGYACPHFHNVRDKRRSPKQYKYRYASFVKTMLYCLFMQWEGAFFMKHAPFTSPSLSLTAYFEFISCLNNSIGGVDVCSVFVCDRSTPCPNVKHGDEWCDPSQCENGDSCVYCHTRTEQQFHPEVRNSVVISWL
jgi:hypothetical protein